MTSSNINFNSFAYYPTLRTRSAEMLGYIESTKAVKDAIAPIFVLTNWGTLKDLNRVSARLVESVNERPFILDLGHDPLTIPEDANRLRNPGNDFEVWRNFVSSVEGAVPTALIQATASSRQIVQQARKLEQKHGRLVIRARNFAVDLAHIKNIALALDDVANAMFVLDFGQLNSTMDDGMMRALETINQLREVGAEATIAMVASSYPRSVTQFDDQGATIEIKERSLHRAMGGDECLIYGDYGSIFAGPIDNSFARAVPRIELATRETWVFRRRRIEEGGYPECAKQISTYSGWNPRLSELTWGGDRIADAAKGRIDKMGSASKWISVRVNLHLHQQVNYATGFDQVDECDDAV